MDSSEDIITAETAGCLDGLLVERAHRSPQGIAYRQFDKPSGQWVDMTWSQVLSEVGRWHDAIKGLDLQEGDRVALLMRNSREWAIAEQAALGLGLVIVPLYCDDRPDNMAYIMEDSGTRLLIANTNLWKRAASACGEIDSLEHIVVVPADGDKATEVEGVLNVESWLPGAAAAPEKRKGNPDELATIVYTSGTTGRPKGVMLSHRNILSIAHAALKSYEVFPSDNFMSFLPLSHTFERTVGYYLPMMSGATVTYARSVAQLADDLASQKPTAMVAVPRIFERFYARIEQQLVKKSAIARGLFRFAVRVGWARFEWQQGRANFIRGLLACMLWPLMDKLVASKVRARMGGKLRLCVSGGAALPFGVARSMIGLGITITQGYGLTETSPVICGNPLDNNDPSGVGVALRGVETRIGESDELLVKTPGMMLGYWNNHSATAEMIDQEGWLHTGDQARIENDHIYITGRIKDILVLSNGEKVPPGDMELTMSLDPLFDQIMVIGEGQAYMSAIIVLNSDEWIALANKHVIDPYQADSLNNAKIHNEVLKRCRSLLHEFPGYAKIRRVILTLEPWTVDNGLITPTLKVKRPKVLEAYKDAIASVYE